MRTPDLRTASVACALTLLFLAAGCRRHHGGLFAPGTPDYTSEFQPILSSGRLSMLRWPNFADVQQAAQNFYSSRDFDLAWSRDGKPTPQATAFIQIFQSAQLKGLDPEDYGASRWQQRIHKISGSSSQDVVDFDVAMTVSAMRLLSDLHMGRINPTHFNFEIDSASKRLDLAALLTNQAINSSDIPGLVASVEPDSQIYRATEQALPHYLDLAKQQAANPHPPLPPVKKSVGVGDRYSALADLWSRLQLEGDAAKDAEAPTGITYTKAVAEAVKHYQESHGLDMDGKLGAATIASLNVPMSQRVTQIDDSLERWRWLPEPYLHPRLMVNLPEFVLRGFDEQHKLAFSMRVVTGQAKDGHDTPVFTHMMRYLVFRPYWNVPTDIAKKELVPHMLANPHYLESKNYEVTNNKGKVLPSYTVHQVQHAMVLVREKPGPGNSLGLVKFMFPNQYDIYLHSTPATYLFDRPRRDYSHGCIRVQKPDQLAAWVLDGQLDKDHQPWDLQKVQDAMNNGEDNHQVNLKTPLPIVIFYLTAYPGDDGQMHFFNDIYHYDADLRQALAQGRPYPIAPQPINPKTQPGDTV